MACALATAAPLQLLILLALLLQHSQFSRGSLFKIPRPYTPLRDVVRFTRADFPDNFLFGAITSSMKHEGAEYVDNKSQNIWDVYAKREKATEDGAVPGQCGDNYNQYKTDHDLLVDMGMNAYRFSIAWSRIYPNGSGEVNQVAIDHYNKVIDDVLEKGLTPIVTLWTQDHPHILDETYGGALNTQFIEDFANYAETCFNAFGDRIKIWITFDEGNDWSGLGYASDQNPPGRCTPNIFGQLNIYYGNCPDGDSALEPYIVGHNVLLAHAEAVSIYREKYQPSQNGSIGMAIWFRWSEPLTNSSEDIAAAQRANDYLIGWFMDPIFFGDYPSSMRDYLGPRLPTFTQDQIAKLNMSLDFIGLNIVTALYVYDADFYLTESQQCYYLDWRVNATGERDGVPIGEGEHDYSVPWIMWATLKYMSKRYNNFPSYVTQTGLAIDYEGSWETLNDESRIHYFQTYYNELLNAINEGIDVRGVFAWSLIDGFEFNLGLGTRVGLHYVDNELKRYPRLSALWFKELLSDNSPAVTISSRVI